jgi:hypothetical protein
MNLSALVEGIVDGLLSLRRMPSSKAFRLISSRSRIRTPARTSMEPPIRKPCSRSSRSVADHGLPLLRLPGSAILARRHSRPAGCR